MASHAVEIEDSVICVFLLVPSWTYRLLKTQRWDRPEIAQKARLQRITDIAKNRLGIDDQHLEPYGHYKAKVSLDYVNSLAGQPDGKLILVTAITPTPAGEGKTTTTVGLGDAL